MSQTGQYNPARTVNYHCLAIGDCYIAIKRLETAGKLRLVGFSSEPDCWLEIAGIQLKPDLAAVLAYEGRERLSLFLEVDMGSESQRQLRGKLEAYYRAWGEADVNEYPVFPKVLWCAVDKEREKELRFVIEQGPKEAQQLFEVTTIAELGEKLTR